MKKFTAALQDKAWELVNQMIELQRDITPDEYDVISIIERASSDMRRRFDLDYAKVYEYLDSRYERDGR